MSYKNTNWKKELTEAFRRTGESFDDILNATLSDAELEEMFSASLGIPEGKPFLAWSKNFVYFSIVSDGAQWVECVPRNPIDFKVGHIGE